MEFNNETTENTVKLSFEGQMRRFPFKGTSFAALHEQIISLLGLEKNADILLKYTDEEGDLITISSDLELKTALVAGQLLRIVGAYRMSMSDNPVTPAEEPTPFAQGGDPLRSFAQGFGRGGWNHTPGGPFASDKERKKAHKLHNKIHGKGGWHHGHQGFPPGFGPQGFPTGLGSHGGPPRGFPHGPHGAPDFPHVPLGPQGGPPPGFPPHDSFGPRGYGPRGGHHGPHGHGPYFGPYGGHHGHGFGFPQDAKDKLVARFAKDVTVEDGTQIPPNTSFVKTWRIRNEGIAWPAGCLLRFVGKHSDDMGGPEFVAVEGVIAPEQEVEISVPLVAPNKPGRYTGYWKMSTPDGRKFGQRVWVSIVVPSANGSSSEGEKEADLYESLVDVVLAKEYLRSYGVKRHRVFRLLQKLNGDTEKVIALLTEKLAHKEEKNARKAEKCAHKQMKKEWKH